MQIYDYAALEGLTLDAGVTVSLSGSSWAALMLAMSAALDPGLWVLNGGSVDALDEILSEAISSLMAFTENGVAVNKMTSELYLPAHALRNTIVVTTHAVDAASYNHEWVYQSVPVNGGDVVMFRVALHVGWYKLLVNFYKGNNCGKFFPVFDGVETSELATIDGYAVSATYNNYYVWDVEVLTEGECDVYIRVNGKHASSSNYYVVLNSVCLKPVWG